MSETVYKSCVRVCEWNRDMGKWIALLAAEYYFPVGQEVLAREKLDAMRAAFPRRRFMLASINERIERSIEMMDA